jgi:hypothetical protein
LAEPPSVEGTGGGQTDEAELEAAAVVLAACVDVSGISPGNSKGVCELPEAEPVAPVVPLADPVVVVDCDNTVWPCCWPWAVVMPSNMIAMMKTNFIALSCVDYRDTALPPMLLDNARPAKNENEI